MTMAALFVAQATNTHLTLLQQFTILGVALLTSKGASGVQGAAFIALVATMMVIPTIPVAGMALILGIDRFLSMCRAVVNMTGNAVATLVIARWENELDRDALQRHLQGGTAGNGRSYKAQAGILDNHAYRSQDFIRFREPSPVSRHCAASSESIASMATLTIRQLDQKTKTRLRV